MMIDMIAGLFGRTERAYDLQTALSNVDPWLYDAWGGTASMTGVRVNRKTALGHAPVYRAVDLISSMVAKTPLVIYRRTDNDGKERDKDHPAYWLVRHEPNGLMNAHKWKETMQNHALFEGNGYTYIWRKRNGTPTELLLLDPATMEPMKVDEELWYIWRSGAETRKLPAVDVIHVSGMGYDGIKGYPLLQYAKEVFGLGIAARDHVSHFFGNGARPGGVLKSPKVLNKEQKQELRQSVDHIHGGLERSHRLMLLEGGMEYEPVTMSARDAQATELRQLDVRDVATLFGLPPHLLGDPTRTSYNSLESEKQGLLDFCLDPWFCRWEAELWGKLLTEDEKRGDTHVVEFLRQSLVQADIKTRYESYKNASAGVGWISVNEIRVRENLPKIEDPKADQVILPVNLAPLGDEKDEPADPGAPPPPAPPPPNGDGGDGDEEDDEDRHRPLLVETIARMIRRVGVQARRAAKREGFASWLHAAEERHAPVIDLALSQVAAAARPDQDAADTARRMRRFIFANINDRLVGKDAAGVDAGLTEVEAILPDQIADDFFGGRDP